MKEIKLKSPIWKPLLALLLNLSFVILGLYLLWVKGVNFAWFTIALFGTGTVLSIVQLIPISSYLIIGSKGITIKTLLQTTKLEWKDIQGFYTKKILFSNLVMIQFSDSFHGKYLSVKVDSMLTSRENTLPGNYGKSADELCEILMKYKNYFQ